MRLSVRDTGYGIAPEYLPRLFRPFDRLGAESGPIDGTGMGLALSKGLVEAMGGTIGVETELDVGSTFWIELAPTRAPIETLGDLSAIPASDDRVDRPRRLILQIEDNASNVRLVEQVIARRGGLEMLVAMTGAEGAELARQHHPDAILLDLHLPDGSGREVLTRLKADPATRDIPVIVVTADATKSQELALRADGALDYVTKPIDVAGLLATIDAALEADGASA
jgi:CheY-like chemotaxis protein